MATLNMEEIFRGCLVFDRARPVNGGHANNWRAISAPSFTKKLAQIYTSSAAVGWASQNIGAHPNDLTSLVNDQYFGRVAEGSNPNSP